MENNRRKFMKLTSIGAVGLMGGSILAREANLTFPGSKSSVPGISSFNMAIRHLN